MPVLFIVNPISGKRIGKSRFSKLVNRHFGQNAHIEYSREAGHARILAQKAIEDKNTETVVAVGGDGTINEIAVALLNSETKFGIVPVGSGNGLARSLNIPVHAERAMMVIKNNNAISIDVGALNEHHFFGVAGIGLDALVSARFQKLKKRGALPYFYHGVGAYFSYDFPDYWINDGKEQHIESPMVITVANSSQYGNGAKIAPHADLQDGLLDVCIIRKTSFIKSLIQLRHLFKGTIEHSGVYKSFLAEQLTISTEPGQPIKFHLDGEPFSTDGDLQIRLIKRALKVLV